MRRETERFWNSQLENAVTVPDFAAWQDRHEALSALADALGRPERISTGPEDLQAVWHTKLGRNTHALVFVHGGYWRRFSADNFVFVAETAAASNASFFNVDYRLMPETRMADVIDDVVRGCEVALQRSDTVVVVGHSAGAHLAVEAALRMTRPPDAVIAISGIFDLDPLRYAFIQAELCLTPSEVQEFSPLHRADTLDCPLHLRTGASETVEFRRQSARMYEAVIESGGEATIEFMDNHHHSSIVAELADPGSVLSHLVQNILA
ncbi:hypothetical protein DLJ53_08100 [Acuticoccus sediminis]|uniref:Alpha/beta hydrolase fold-3 domain-containing protein n=1 Tax=Acuticoccus sediminis TaxID=2184697 RepID=A0A8B2P714_9HYPH|nr:alpha/beta hydrolase [Acuticoccus sediminis]RAI04389.1 hypothetical protein DLJ53_08100 [Acuticoccus sediminis]